MLSDALQTLRTLEVFAAYRLSRGDPSAELPAQLMWDAPTGADWDDASHVARGLRSRAEQLFEAVTHAQVEDSLWRDQRAMAESAHLLLNLGDALAAYRNRVDALGTGDGSSALNLLDAAWTQWDTVAARFTMSRSEPIPCAA